MADENVSSEVKPVSEKNGKKAFFQMVLYKMDRTLAIAGIIAMGIVAMAMKNISSTASQICMAAVGALAVYIGGRAVKQEEK